MKIPKGLSKRKLLDQMRVAMEGERSSFISRWRDLNDFILPTRGRFTVTDNNRGNRVSTKIVDSTATIDARTLASGMMSGITSPARPWFRLTVPDPDLGERENVKRWLYICTERERWVLSRSNFYNKAPLVYQDMGVFGTAGLLCVEDDHKVVRFMDAPVGSFCIALNENLEPAVFTREYRMSVRQLVRKFGLERVTDVVQRHWERGQHETLIEVVHVIQPNDERDPNALYSKDHMPFYSCYYEKNAPTWQEGKSEFLRESGFEEFPGMFPRWEVAGDDIYGTNSPGMTALGDVRQLQQGEKLSLQAVERMVKPPMTGPNALKQVRATNIPGEITYLDVREGQQGFRPAYEVKFDVEKLEYKQAQARSRIDRAFFADLFLMLSYMDDKRQGKQPVTAAEIYERHEEKLLALGPVLEQLNQDFLDPIIDRVFNIMQRRGFIPPPPPEIQGMDLKVEYISMLHQAQKSQALGGLRSVVEFILPMADQDPSVWDKVDKDNLIDHFAEGAGVPPDVIRAEEQVTEIRTARAAQAKAAADAEQTKVEAEAAKTLSETDTTKDSALRDITTAAEQGRLPAGVI